MQVNARFSEHPQSGAMPGLLGKADRQEMLEALLEKSEGSSAASDPAELRRIIAGAV
jgi:hypothetical protein